MNSLTQLANQVRHLMTRRIWQSEVLADRSLRGRGYAALRVISMTWSGMNENRLTSRAGALSYFSALGFAPLVALIVLFSSIVLQNNDPTFVVRQLNRAIEFIAPQLRHLQGAANTGQTTGNETAVPPPGSSAAAESPSNASTQEPAPRTAPSTQVETPAAAAPESSERQLTASPELETWLEDFFRNSQSKAIGIMGVIALLFIVIRLFASIEDAFNDVWGVRRGRNWLLRIVFYWAAVSLGAVLTFASLTLLSFSTFVNLVGNVPWVGATFQTLFNFAVPAISAAVLVGLLTVFYKFIPNTSVGWKPAFIGAAVVVALLNLNNYLAFLYLSQTDLNRTLYGPLVVAVVLMLGLYIFWLFLLIGGQITYAVQNANYRSSNMAWDGLNHASRQGIALVLFSLICRRFRDCQPAYTAPQISELIKIPTQILNACLARLIALGLVSRIPPDDVRGSLDYRFQPARPLDRIKLAEFKDLFETYGEGPSRAILDSLDPVVRFFHSRLLDATNEALGDETVESVISRLSGELPAATTETFGMVRTR